MSQAPFSGVIPRPSAHAPPSWVCNRCDFVLFDGVHYELCPRCNFRVDWVDLHLPLWACPGCARMINAEVGAAPGCEACRVTMRRLTAHEAPVQGGTRTRGLVEVLGPLSVIVVVAAACLPALSLALDPQWRWQALGFFGPLLLLPALAGGWLFGSLIAGWRELLALASDARTRVVHGFEHAAAHLLEADGQELAGGETSPGRFTIALKQDPRLSEAAFGELTTRAIHRIGRGERHLAFHRLCGSSFLVAAVLAAAAAVASSGIGLLTQQSPQALAGWALGLLLASVLLARPLGLLLQKTVSVSTRFRAARVTAVKRWVRGEWVIYEASIDVEL